MVISSLSCPDNRLSGSATSFSSATALFRLPKASLPRQLTCLNSNFQNFGYVAKQTNSIALIRNVPAKCCHTDKPIFTPINSIKLFLYSLTSFQLSVISINLPVDIFQSIHGCYIGIGYYHCLGTWKRGKWTTNFECPDYTTILQRSTDQWRSRSRPSPNIHSPLNLP